MLDAAASLKLLDSALTVTSGIHVRPCMNLVCPVVAVVCTQVSQTLKREKCASIRILRRCIDFGIVAIEFPPDK